MRCSSKLFAIGLLAAVMISCGGTSSTGGFSVSAEPTSLSVSSAGNENLVQVWIASKDGFNGQIAVTVKPAGLLTIQPPATLHGGTGTYMLTFVTSQDLSAGTYPFTLLFTSGNLQHPINMTLQVGK